MTAADGRRPPLTPKEGWLIQGRHVQRLEITTGELLPHQSTMLFIQPKTSF